MKLEDMPVVTVEEVLRFRAEAIKQRNELSAVVERQREALMAYINAGFGISTDPHKQKAAYDLAKEAYCLKPATALRLHDAEVLERAYEQLGYLDHYDNYIIDGDDLKEEIARLRAGGEG